MCSRTTRSSYIISHICSCTVISHFNFAMANFTRYVPPPSYRYIVIQIDHPSLTHVKSSSPTPSVYTLGIYSSVERAKDKAEREIYAKQRRYGMSCYVHKTNMDRNGNRDYRLLRRNSLGEDKVIRELLVRRES